MKRIGICLAVLGIAVLSSSACAAVRLPAIFGSDMVLQRNMRVPAWGWAQPGEEITVKLDQHEARTKADSKGAWKLTLPVMKAGGPYEMTVSGKNTLKLTNVMIGEVWLCSGQSNMWWQLRNTVGGQKASAVDYPNIRLFSVAKHSAGLPQDDLKGKWKPCKRNSKYFSAVAYYFGRMIHKELGVPVGMINSSVSSTGIEAWTPRTGFALIPECSKLLKEVDRDADKYRKRLAATPNSPPRINASKPTVLYNGMLHPLVPFALRGALWYQGERSVIKRDGMKYHYKMKALISGWRKVWGQGNFPFYFVQLPPFDYSKYRVKSPKELPKIWEAQARTLSVINTGMAVIHDTVTNTPELHPRNKAPVGKRLALWALAKDYDRKDLVYSGPLYKSHAIEQSKIRVRFKHIGGGLTARDGKPLSHFQIAGADQKLVSAETKIDGDSVLVWSKNVSKPVAVRFGWHQEARPNLMNKKGLPASPFRTDKSEK